MAQPTYIFNRRLGPQPKGSPAAVPYVVGNWYMPPDVRAGATVAPGVGTMRMFPFVASQDVTISQLGIFVVTGVAAANAQFAVYTADPTTHLPIGAPLGTTGNVAVATSSVTASGALNANVQLKKGALYYFAMNIDTAAVTVTTLHPLGLGSASQVGDASLANILTSGSSLGGYFVTQTFGTWPALTGSTTFSRFGGASFPAIAMKVASVP